MAIYIPISDNSSCIELSELPEEEDALDLLSTELPPLSCWLNLAMAYYRRHKFSSFEQILRSAVSEDLEKLPQYKDSKEIRIAILNRLSGYYLKKLSMSSEKHLREEYSNLSGEFNRLADKQSINAKSNWVYRGYWLLEKGTIDNAVYYFNNTLLAESENVLALLGRACIYYHQGNFQEALNHYINILRIHPRCPPNIRLGIGHCHYRLGNKHIAQKAYKRVLQLDPENAEALIALATLEQEQGKSENYLVYLTKAYQADNSNALVNLHLARHYFYRQEFDKSAKLAEISLSRLGDMDKQVNDIAKLKAECYLVLAQGSHAQGDFEKAFRFYTNSSKLVRNSPIAQYGLGQMYVHQKDLAKAVPCFEAVLELCPGNYEASRVLGSLYLRQHRKEQAMEKLQYAVDVNPKDFEMWIEIGQSCEIFRPAQALDAYEKALVEIPNPPAALLNNVAILRHKAKNTEGAEEAYGRITEQSKTFTYNKARWLEDIDRIDEAESIYKTLLEENKSFVDVYLRLSMIERKRKDYVKALELVRKAIEIDKRPVHSLCQKGALEAELGEFKKALDTLNKVINEYSHHDVYCLVSMGNQYYELAVRAKDYTHLEQNLKRALEYYLKVLSLDEHNAFAANGAAMILAEFGDYQQAQAYFKQIYDPNGNLPFILVNQAHLFFLQEKYDTAIILYRRALENNALPEHILKTYLATSLFASKEFEEAISVLMTLEKSAANTYNLAACLYEYARHTFKKQKRKVEETKNAIQNIEEAITLFEEIKTTKWKVSGGNEARAEHKRMNDWAVRKSSDKLEQAKKLLDDSQEFLAHDQMVEQQEIEQRQKHQQELMELLSKRAPNPIDDLPYKQPKLS